jgi:hypothetical protein
MAGFLKSAFARATATSRGARAPFAGAGLALVPIGVFALLWLLLWPHAVEPREVPLPDWDTREWAANERDQAEWSALARSPGLASDVKELGSALRNYHRSMAEGARDSAELAAMKDELLTLRNQIIATRVCVSA